MHVLIISTFPPDQAPEANQALPISERLANSGIRVQILSKKGQHRRYPEKPFGASHHRRLVVVGPVQGGLGWRGRFMLNRYLSQSRHKTCQ